MSKAIHAVGRRCRRSKAYRTASGGITVELDAERVAKMNLTEREHIVCLANQPR